MNLSTFIENPDNPQTVTDADFALLVESIRKLPQTLAVNKIAYVTDYVALDGTDLRGQRVVIAGNKRLRALKKLAQEHATSADGQIAFDRPLPDDWFFDLTPLGLEAREAWLVKSNIQSGEWDAEKLLALYDAEQLGDLMGADACAELLRSVSEASAEEKKGETDPDDVPEAPVETTSKRGEVYQLGPHRLMCGDSTDSLDFAKLTGGGLADMVFTDPPWNVNYGACDEDNAQGYKKRTILNDSMTTAEFKEFMMTAFRCMNTVTKPGGMVYVVMSSQEWGNMMLALAENDYHWSSTIIWNKDRLVLSRKDYHTKYEPIWYGWKNGEARLCPLEDRTQSDVWDFDRPAKSEEHPTMKPVELVKRAIANSSRRGDTVLDPFGGSGTTIIACEQLGRRCRMMELDPHYCDVIRKRWAEFVHGAGCDWQALTPATP